jgi:hypothetical protein
MKVGDLVKIVHSPDPGMMGIIVELVSWQHTETKTPFVLWGDGSIRKIQWGVIEVINESG